MTVTKRIEHYPYVQAKWHSSRGGTAPSVVVMHYTAGRGDSAALSSFFRRGTRKASAHFGIGRPGDVVQMVELDRNAWHAGTSSFMGMKPVGPMSVGIEVCNTGYAYLDRLPHTSGGVVGGSHRNPRATADMWEEFTDAQYDSINVLLRDLKAAIPTLKWVTGHEDIRNPGTVVGLRGAKTDPGPAFRWSRLDLASVDMLQSHFSFRDAQWYTLDSGEEPTH
jgi:N-acetylmuramoyl-L-alanine amidase